MPYTCADLERIREIDLVGSVKTVIVRREMIVIAGMFCIALEYHIVQRCFGRRWRECVGDIRQVGSASLGVQFLPLIFEPGEQRVLDGAGGKFQTGSS